LEKETTTEKQTERTEDQAADKTADHKAGKQPAIHRSLSEQTPDQTADQKVEKPEDQTTAGETEKPEAQLAAEQTASESSVDQDANDRNDDSISLAGGTTQQVFTAIDVEATTLSTVQSTTNVNYVAQKDKQDVSARVQAAQSQEILRVRPRPGHGTAAGQLRAPPPVERALFSYQDLFSSRPVNVRASLPVQYGLNMSIARLNYEFATPAGPTAQFAVAAANRINFRPPAVKKAARMEIVGNISVGEPIPVDATRHILIGQ
jgi:hypothetical protein